MRFCLRLFTHFVCNTWRTVGAKNLVAPSSWSDCAFTLFYTTSHFFPLAAALCNLCITPHFFVLSFFHLFLSFCFWFWFSIHAPQFLYDPKCPKPASEATRRNPLAWVSAWRKWNGLSTESWKTKIQWIQSGCEFLQWQYALLQGSGAVWRKEVWPGNPGNPTNPRSSAVFVLTRQFKLRTQRCI